jgi:glucose/arabinose dehydrogenase
MSRTRAAARSRRLTVQPLEDRRTPTVLPAGFTETLLTTNSNLSSPTAMEFSPTGQLWVLEQGGALKVVQANGTTHTAISLTVDSAGERGLLGIAFDPQYDGAGPNADLVYLYLTVPRANSTDPANNLIRRYTVTGAGTPTPTLGSPQLIRELPPEDEDNNLTTNGDTNHNGGAMHFGPDDKLYVAVGDHNYDNTPQSQHVSQLTTTPFGKLLRLNPDGSNPSDNPFYTGSPTDWAGSIYALGLRNPYTFAIDPATEAIFINDVGESNWEEINEAAPAANYGWAGSSSPLWEGFESSAPWANYRNPAMAYDHQSGGVSPAGIAITGGAFYPANSQFGAAYAGKYFYSDFGANFIRVFDPASPGTSGTPDTSTGFATQAPGPVDLKVDAAGSLYYLSRGGTGEVFRISFQAPGISQHPTDVTVDAGQPATFNVTATGGAPLSYQWQKLIASTWTNITGATASSYTIGATAGSDAGQYRVIVTNSAGSATSNAATLTVNTVNQPPDITDQPDDQSVNVGEPASFTVTANGAAPLGFQWQKLIGPTWTDVNGATAATLSFASAAAADEGEYRVVVTNSVGSDTSDPATLTVNEFPTATITAGGTYTFGQTINFSATATDPEDGTLPASAYTWRVDFGHDTHFHPHVAAFSGATGGSFVADFGETAPNQFYRVILTVEDSTGAEFTTTFDVQPVLAQLTLASNPAGVPLTIDGQPATGAVGSVVGMGRTIQAPESVMINGLPYEFVGWSDGGAATHVVTTPATNTTYTADYAPAFYTAGLKAEFFDFTTPLSVIPNLTGLSPAVVRTDATLNYAATSAAWKGLDSRFQNTFAARHTGFLNVTTAGDYTLYLRSDEGSKLWVDGALVVDNDGRHGMRERSAVVNLAAGYHDVRVEYFENTGSAGLQLKWAGPGVTKRIIPAANLVQTASVGPRAYRPDATGAVVIEAEDADGSAAGGNRTWVHNAGKSGFAGTGAMRAEPNTGVTRDTNFTANSPRLDYRVTFEQAGTYYVWVRGRAASATDNSVHVGLDGAAVATADRINGLPANYGWINQTIDGPVATLVIDTPGVHTVNLWMREDGAIVDRLLLTPDVGFTPTGLGPATSPHEVPGLNYGNGFAGPAGLTTTGSADVVGSTLRLTSGGTNEAGSAFSSAEVAVDGFSTTFDFRLTSALADGFAFVIQGNAATALGSSGSGLGYQGIGNSLALTFDLSDNTTGFYTNGAAPTGGGVDLTAAGLDLRSGHAFRASVAYAGGTLWLTLRDLETGLSVTESYTANVSALVGGSTAHVGFTGATGAATATQEILNWAYWG